MKSSFRVVSAPRILDGNCDMVDICGTRDCPFWDPSREATRKYMESTFTRATRDFASVVVYEPWEFCPIVHPQYPRGNHPNLYHPKPVPQNPIQTAPVPQAPRRLVPVLVKETPRP